MLGLGMGGEWATGAALVAETWPAEHRGKALGVMQSAWAVGYAAAAAVNAVVLPVWGWRGVFLAGVAPALLTLWIRRSVEESQVWLDGRARPARRGPRMTAVRRPAAAPGADRRRDECRDDVRVVGALHVDPVVSRAARGAGRRRAVAAALVHLDRPHAGGHVARLCELRVPRRIGSAAAAPMSPTCSSPRCSSRSMAPRAIRWPAAAGSVRGVFRHRLLQRLRRGDGRNLPDRRSRDRARA